MSISLMNSAWRLPIPAGQKFVLLALCDNANDQGECFPSIPMVASKCSMGERTVQAHISDLEREGFLRREIRAGRSTVYHINPAKVYSPAELEAIARSNPRKSRTPADSAPPQNSHHTPADSAPPPPQNSHPTPADFAPITISEPPSEPSVNQKQPRFDARQHLATLGVSEQIAADWLALRKSRRAAVTMTVLAGIQREAAKADITVQAALQICCERGWQSFQADWMQRAAQGQPRTMTRDEGRAVAAASRLTDFLNDDGTPKVPEGAANGLEPHATRLLG